jgi:hypothetical protein
MIPRGYVLNLAAAYAPRLVHPSATRRRGPERVVSSHSYIAPESFGRDFNRDRNVDLASGEQLYVKIVSLDSWGASVCASKNIARDAFYAWVIPPEVAQAEIGRDRRGI